MADLQTQTLKRTPLYEDHVVLKAKMVPFGGWDMPVQYEGILEEYEQTRRGVTLFDTSHMGEFLIEGDVKETGLDHIVTMALADMPLKTCRYGLILNEQGGTIDDTIVFRVEENKWFIVVNGGTTQKDADHFRKHLNKNASFQDISFSTGKLDLQGPLSRDILSKFIDGIEKLNYYSFDYFKVLGENALVSRTGYTGELGYEIFFPWDKTKILWQALLKEPEVKPAGLGARDVLRLEMGYSLYGHELSDDINPLEAGLSKFIDFSKDFIGKNALLKQKEVGLKRKIIGFISENRRSPRQGHNIYSAQEEQIGVVTSGTFSPYLNKGIGLGFVNTSHGTKDEAIFFGDNQKKNPAVISSRSFYNQGSLKE